MAFQWQLNINEHQVVITPLEEMFPKSQVGREQPLI